MGGNIIPALVEQGAAWVYDFLSNEVPGQHERERGYWRDVGTLDAYYEASMDLVVDRPDLRPLQPALADPHLAFPLSAGQVRARSGRAGGPGPQLAGRPRGDRLGRRRPALHPLARRAGQLLRRGRRTASCSRTSTSAARPSCGGRSSTRTCGCPTASQIGVDLERDRERFTVSDDGVVVIEKGTRHRTAGRISRGAAGRRRSRPRRRGLTS